MTGTQSEIDCALGAQWHWHTGASQKGRPCDRFIRAELPQDSRHVQDLVSVHRMKER